MIYDLDANLDMVWRTSGIYARLSCRWLLAAVKDAFSYMHIIVTAVRSLYPVGHFFRYRMEAVIEMILIVTCSGATCKTATLRMRTT